MAAGPGPWNSAAIGPRLLVGVHVPLWPPILFRFQKNSTALDLNIPKSLQKSDTIN